MKMGIFVVAVVAALASRVALAADQGGQPSDSVGVVSAPAASNDNWRPPFGGHAVRSTDAAAVLAVDWQPPFGGRATRSGGVAAVVTAGWQPPFGG